MSWKAERADRAERDADISQQSLSVARARAKPPPSARTERARAEGIPWSMAMPPSTKRALLRPSSVSKSTKTADKKEAADIKRRVNEAKRRQQKEARTATPEESAKNRSQARIDGPDAKDATPDVVPRKQEWLLESRFKPSPTLDRFLGPRPAPVPPPPPPPLSVGERRPAAGLPAADFRGFYSERGISAPPLVTAPPAPERSLSHAEREYTRSQMTDVFQSSNPAYWIEEVDESSGLVYRRGASNSSLVLFPGDKFDEATQTILHARETWSAPEVSSSSSDRTTPSAGSGRKGLNEMWDHCECRILEPNDATLSSSMQRFEHDNAVALRIDVLRTPARRWVDHSAWAFAIGSGKGGHCRGNAAHAATQRRAALLLRYFEAAASHHPNPTPLTRAFEVISLWYCGHLRLRDPLRPFALYYGDGSSMEGGCLRIAQMTPVERAHHLVPTLCEHEPFHARLKTWWYTLIYRYLGIRERSIFARLCKITQSSSTTAEARVLNPRYSHFQCGVEWSHFTRPLRRLADRGSFPLLIEHLACWAITVLAHFYPLELESATHRFRETAATEAVLFPRRTDWQATRDSLEKPAFAEIEMAHQHLIALSHRAAIREMYLTASQAEMVISFLASYPIHHSLQYTRLKTLPSTPYWHHKTVVFVKRRPGNSTFAFLDMRCGRLVIRGISHEKLQAADSVYWDLRVLTDEFWQPHENTAAVHSADALAFRINATPDSRKRALGRLPRSLVEDMEKWEDTAIAAARAEQSLWETSDEMTAVAQPDPPVRTTYGPDEDLSLPALEEG